MSNLIQIKRSLTSAAPGSLANGEFAYTANGDVLYIGSNGVVVPIGGRRNPGVLTANQALVANATSGIDRVIVANLIPTAVYANGSLGTAGQLLTSNGTAVYWNTPAPSVVGSNTQIQFNDEGNLGADADFTFNKVTNTLSTPNVVITSVTASTNTTTGALRVAGGVGVNGRINTTDLAAGNDAVFSTLTGTTLSIANVFASSTVNATTLSIGTSTVANSLGVYAVGTVNAASHTVGTALIGNSTGLFTTGTVNGAVLSVGTSTVANSLGVYAVGTVNAASHTVGSALVGNSTGLFTTGTVNGAVVSVGSAVVGNSTGIFTTGTVNGSILSVGTNIVGNSTGVFATGTVNASTLSVGTAFVANSTRLAVGSAVGLVANGGLGTAGQVLHSNGTAIYWDVDNDGVTSVATGAGLTGGTITTTGTLSVLANNGTIANSTGLFVRPGTGVTVNATGVHIGQAVSTTSNVTFANVVTTNLNTNTLLVSTSVSSNLMPTANNTYHLGNSTVQWAQIHAANVHGGTGIFNGNLEVAGNIIVTGNLVTQNVSSVIVSDAKILLAANNAGDILDIGFSGTYTDGASVVRHAGLFRDASDSGVFKFFTETTQDLTGNNVVNTTAVGYTTAVLETYLRTTGLTTNATHVRITANSTVNVAIIANTLTLSTALAGTSGGTGRATTTNNAILVGNTTNGYNELPLAADGYVLQSNGTALIYDILDGGTF